MKKLINIIDKNCIEYKNRNAFSIQTILGTYRTYTYSKVLENIKKYSLEIKKFDITEGDRIALIAENSPEWVISYLSILNCNCTPVLIDPSLSKPELSTLIQKSDIRALILSSNILIKIDAISNITLPIFRITENGIMFDESNQNKLLPASPTSDPNSDIIAIIYSSGTTSTAKGVMLDNEGIIKTAENNIISNELSCKDRFLAVIPLYHIYGFMSKMICPLLCGGLVCFIEDVNSKSLIKTFVEFKPTTFCGVPRIFDMFASKIYDTVNSKGDTYKKLFKLLLNLSYTARKHTKINLGKVIFGSVHKIFGGEIRCFLSAGSLLDEQIAKLYFSLGFNLLNNYGITETNIPITANSYSNYTLDTCGNAFRDVQISIRNSNEQGLGEILVKSPGIMKGYFRDKEATDAAFDSSGWFCTGDIGCFNENKNLLVTGRIKENIVLDTGKKVAPSDIEKAYGNIQGISELIIAGVPKNKNCYDEIHVFLVKDTLLGRENQLIESELWQIASSLPVHMKISKIHFLDSIPKTSLEKPKRYLLKQIALQETTAHQEASCSNEIQDNLSNASSYLNTIYSIISSFRFVSGNINENHRLFEDLGFDSLSATEFCFLLEKRTGISISSYLKANITIAEIVTFLNKTNISDIQIIDTISRFPMQKRLHDIIIFKLLKTIVKLVYKFKVTGIENIPYDGKYLICPNHETHLDPFFIMANSPKTIYEKFYCLAKTEHMSNIFGRTMLRIGGGIPVDRYGNPSPALSKCYEKLQEGKIVLIHPEGTRTNDGELGIFKKGAAKLSIDTDSPIIPVRIKGGFQIYPKGKFMPKLFDFKNFKRYQIEISFGKALFPLGHDTDSLTSELRTCIIHK